MCLVCDVSVTGCVPGQALCRAGVGDRRPRLAQRESWVGVVRVETRGQGAPGVAGRGVEEGEVGRRCGRDVCDGLCECWSRVLCGRGGGVGMSSGGGGQGGRPAEGGGGGVGMQGIGVEMTSLGGCCNGGGRCFVWVMVQWCGF